jgi:UDP-N-acetylmuramate dehydrogenase
MQILENILLAPFTSYRVGGPARWYCRPLDGVDLADALAFARDRALPVFRLGGGSNVLVSDAGFPGLVIHMTGLATLEFGADGLVCCGSGLPAADLADRVAEHGLAGLAFSGGLPGSVGGAAYMNARAYGGSWSDVVEAVRVMDEDGRETCLPAETLAYAYKHSSLMGLPLTVLEVRLRLAQGDPLLITAETHANREKRREMGQFVLPNAGCIFKNDYGVGIPSGKLIEDSGLRGYACGDAAVFERHCNFIVNRGRASAAQIRELIGIIKQTVLEKKGVLLEEEIRYLGFADDGAPPGPDRP